MKTKLKTSKQLKEWGCEIESKECHYSCHFPGEKKKWTIEPSSMAEEVEKSIVEKIPAYDLIYDICIKHPREFFGEGLGKCNCGSGCDDREGAVVGCNAGEVKWAPHTQRIFNLLQNSEIDNNKEKEREQAEKYFLDNCVFNPKNK